MCINNNLSKQNVVIGINSGNGSIVSTNASYMQGNVLFIDVIFNISVEVAESGELVSFVVNGQNIYFPKKCDLCLYGINSSQVATNKLLAVVAGGNIFFANGSSIPAGVYKLTAILDLN